MTLVLNIVISTLVAVSILVILTSSITPVNSQYMPHPFHESITVLIDRTGSHNVTTSVTLQSTDTMDMKIPDSLESAIREDGRIFAVVVTNHDRCILGVADQSCILISTQLDNNALGITQIQESAFNTAEIYIDEINQLFDTGATFHSVFVHSGNDPSDTATGLPAATAGKTTASVVYVMPMQDTNFMYETISAVLLSANIRDADGFYDVAKTLSLRPHSKMSFSIIPLDNNSLFQLKVASVGNINATLIDDLRPIELMELDTLKRSNYLQSHPLNSILQVVISSPDPLTTISDSIPAPLPTREIDGEKIPTELRDGWIFDSSTGKIIQAKYLLPYTVLMADNLVISLDSTNINTMNNNATTTFNDIDILDSENYEQIVIVIAIVAVTIVTVVFYLRGYSGRSKDLN